MLTIRIDESRLAQAGEADRIIREICDRVAQEHSGGHFNVQVGADTILEDIPMTATKQTIRGRVVEALEKRKKKTPTPPQLHQKPKKQR